jgi:hypothetical protein
MPVPPYLSGVIIIFAFLDLEKTSRLQTTSYILYHRVLKKTSFPDNRSD